jgi:DegV family protein with EDD domain
MAKRTIIVTDSTADLTSEEIKEYEVQVVPLTVHFGSETFQDIPERLSRERFFELLSESTARPTTSSPTITTFREVYEEASHHADNIVSIHISAKLSDTVRRARQASESLLGKSKIQVIDSEVTSVGLGILVKTAARMAQAGVAADEIVRTIRGMIDHIYVVFFVESLDFLEQGGRIGKAQALLGTMLNIKPMLILEQGEIEPLEKVRTRARALDKLAEFVSEFGDVQSLIIMQNNSDQEEIDGLVERIRQVRSDNVPIHVASYGPVLAAHIGPDALGIVVQESPQNYGWE